MPIYPPGLREQKGRRLKRSRSRRAMAAALSLTSMVDMFTIIVIFLLQHYSSTGEIIQLEKDINLPKASVTKQLKPAHVVSLSEKELKLNGDLVYPTQALYSMGMMIPKLRRGLEDILKKEMAKRDTNDEGIRIQKKQRVTLEIDGKVPIKLVKKLVVTCTGSGFPEVNFAVLQNKKSKDKQE